MARAISNVVIATDSFASWVGITNQLADTMTNQALTANSATTGANVTGNSQLIGIFSANTIAVITSLRGGTVNAAANLNITSNAIFSGATVNATSNVEFNGGYVYANVAHFNITGSLANVTSNVSVNAANVSVNSVVTRIDGGAVGITSNAFLNSANVFVNATSTTIQGGGTTITSNVAIQNANTFINATALGVAAVTIVTGNTTLKANSTVDTLQLLGNSTVTTLSVTVNSMSLTGNATYANDVAVTGTLTVTGLTTLNGNVGAPTANLTTALNVGANVNVNTTALKIGNATVNAVVTQTGGFVVGNTTVNTTVNSTAISTTGVVAAGNATITGFINSSSYGTFNGTVNATALNIGANVNVTTVRFNIGNSTVNTFITSTAIETDGTLTVLGATSLSNTLSVAGTLGSGNTTVTGFANVSTTLNVVGAATVNGALTVNNTAAVGNTTVTGFANVSTTLNVVGATTVNGALTVNNTAAVGNITITGFANVSTTLNVVGAATVNGALTVNNTAAVGNTTVTGFVDSSSYGTFAGTVNAAALNIGANVNVTTTSIAVGNAISNVVIDQTDVTFDSTFGTVVLGSITSSPISFNASTGVNGTTEVITTSTNHGFINGDYVQYTVAAGNTAISGLTSGGYYFVVGANTTTGLQLATTLSGSAINLTAGLNQTGHSLTRYSIVLNVGANVTANTTALKIGNTTVNSVLTSTTFALGNSIVNTTINSSSYAVGNSTVNTTINSTSISVGGPISTQGNTTFQNTVTFVVVANGNIGNANTQVGNVEAFSNVELFSFPFAAGAAAKMTGVVTNLTGASSQIQEMLLSHNSSDATLTVYGTVATPVANLGSFSSQINSTHVAVSLKQRSANSNVRLFVQLIK